jgi:flavin-dependent dehydrogenase
VKVPPGGCEELFDVAVIGAGPGGSSAAAALAARGWRVLLVERDRLPRHKVCGEFLSPESQGTLHELGLHANLAGLRPVELAEVQLVSQAGRQLVVPLPAPGWGVSRYAMDAELAAAAVRCSATFWQSTTVTGLTCDGDAYVVAMRSRGADIAICARSVLMAGGRAVAAKLLANPMPIRPERLNVGIKAHFDGIAMPNQVDLYLFEGGYVGINPVESGVANVCLLASYAAFAQANKDPVTMFQWIADQNPAFGRRLAGSRLCEETLSTVAAVDTGLPSRPWNGIACIGDTATMIPPLCGDGMAMALHSATLCVPLADAYLHGKIDLQQWENRYRAEWHAAFDRRLRAGRGLQALLSSIVNERILWAGAKLPLVADYVMRATRGPTSPAPSSPVSSPLA